MSIYPNVPITLVVMWLSPASKSLANPKSETFALNSSSIKMLLDFMSLWTTFGSIASCKYASLHSMCEISSSNELKCVISLYIPTLVVELNNLILRNSTT